MSLMAKRVTPIPKRQPRRHYLREWRAYRGLTQERLAERAGLTPGAISQLENDQVGYTQASLEALANALQCEPAELLGRDPGKDGDVIDLLRLIREKDEAMVRAVLSALPSKTAG